jgi:hypothetical protein
MRAAAIVLLPGRRANATVFDHVFQTRKELCQQHPCGSPMLRVAGLGESDRRKGAYTQYDSLTAFFSKQD